MSSTLVERAGAAKPHARRRSNQTTISRIGLVVNHRKTVMALRVGSVILVQRPLGVTVHGAARQPRGVRGRRRRPARARASPTGSKPRTSRVSYRWHTLVAGHVGRLGTR